MLTTVDNTVDDLGFEINNEIKIPSHRHDIFSQNDLSEEIARTIGADPEMSGRAAHLCKADLMTGMVAEFPSLQGTMGYYYALADGENIKVAQAIREHYAPAGPEDACPTAPISVVISICG